MAKDRVCVYLNSYSDENHVRTFGGNSAEVFMMRKKYMNMTREEFLAEHPRFAEKIGDEFKLLVD